jgi:hypothetical protein
MRGGAISAQIEDADESEDDDWTEPATPQLTNVSRTVLEEVQSNFIYGYNGKFVCRNDPDSFQRTMLRLLGYDLGSNRPWDVLIDLYKPGSLEPTTVPLKSSGAHFHNVFHDRVLPYLHGDPWRVFVRSGRAAASHSKGVLQPSRLCLKYLVRLIGPNDEKDTVYWKIPNNMKPKYGINQCQPGFFGAMKLLLSNVPLSLQGPVTLRFRDSARNNRSFDLGWGSMEATVEFWNAICEAIPKLDRTRADRIDILVSTSPAEQTGDHDLRAHLVGSQISVQASFSSPERTYDEIGRTLTRLATPAVAFRIWRDSRERENGSQGEVIGLEPKGQAVDALKTVLEGWRGKTNCFWFRPEWKSLCFQSLDTNSTLKEVQWSGAFQNLGGLRNTLQQLVGDKEAVESFTLVEARSKQEGRTFVVTGDTSDQEWRMHIYDWIHSNKIYFRKNTKIHYGKISGCNFMSI